MHVPSQRRQAGGFTLLVRGCSAGVLILAGALVAAPGRAAPDRPRALLRAAHAMGQLESDFFDKRLGFYTASRVARGPIVSVWPTSQVLTAAVDIARITHAPADMARMWRIIHSLQAYIGRGGVYHTRTWPSARYTDDNNWIALALLDAYDLTHNAVLLDPVKRIFAYAVSRWKPNGGGILWADTHNERCTVSNGPAITIALRLFALTHRGYYRSWADRIYAWENSHMRRPDGLYWDHIRADGTMDRDIVSYNQGVMIDANLTYARLTGQSRYLREAARIAAAAQRALPEPWRDRGMFADFVGLYVRALAHLNATRPGSISLQTARSYLRWAWPVASRQRAAVDRTEGDLLEQAGFVMIAAAIYGA